MNKAIVLLVFICICFIGCSKGNQNLISKSNNINKVKTVYDFTIDEFKKKFNVAVTYDNIKINNWTEKMPGILEYTFNNQITLSLGISPNEKNLVYIPQLFSDIVEISKIDNFSEILYGVLKAGDENVTLEQAKIIADKISLNQAEIMTIDLPNIVYSKKEIINKIKLEATYLDKKLAIMFYDIDITGK